ncbi:Fic family protein [Nocardioidaceae bacterium SCSIO 66511]|nr:Fic family protein [Nocardioidaceae bacterium SCSIO 66511]
MDSVLVFSGDLPASTISAMVGRGSLQRVAAGVYVRTGNDPAEVVRREWHTIVGRLFPNAVITDRSAPSGGPVDGVLYLAREARARDATLPGLRVRARRGAGPQADDVPLPGGLHLASAARGLAENTRESRQRTGVARTLDDRELGDWVDRICRNEGEQRLAEHRQRAKDLADVLAVPAGRLARLDELVGLALATRNVTTASPALASRSTGIPVDQGRVELFESLVNALSRAAPQSRPAPEPELVRFEPFAEAYFSNFIEGTEFDFDEAAQIVFDGEIPQARPQDAHDIIGTYRLLADTSEMRVAVRDAADFEETVRRRHRRIMEGRPEVRPGEFKQRANRAGGTTFVEPTLVRGTLAAGFALREHLDTAWERAVYIAFVIAEVHPFDDGNGRVARAMMAAELDIGAQSRIIVPTVFRTDYLDGLRMLSRRGDSSVFIKAMRYAHDFTASIDFSGYNQMREQLEEANAFNEPESGDRLRIRGSHLSNEVTAPWRRRR